MNNISNSHIKKIKSLSTTKGRKNLNAFIVERTKNVLEFFSGSFVLKWLVATPEWFDQHFNKLNLSEDVCYAATKDVMCRITTMSTPSDVMAVFEMPEHLGSALKLTNQLYIALAGIQDPGNLGTIIRMADWFGIDTIFASKDTVDCFNPKCLMSTMGSICRVKVIYTELKEVFSLAASHNIPIYGTFMEGEDVFKLNSNHKHKGVIVLGNEGNGIPSDLDRFINKRIAIPRFKQKETGPESLNVAMAAAIIISQFRNI